MGRARRHDPRQRSDAARLSSHRAEPVLAVGQPERLDRDRAGGGVGGHVRPAQMLREEPTDGGPVRRMLVQPAVLAAFDHEALNDPPGVGPSR